MTYFSPKFQIVNGKYIIRKSPTSRLDYGVRLQAWLEPGDSVPLNVQPSWTQSNTGSIAISAPFVVNDPTYGITAGIFVSGGTIDVEEWVACTWTTTNGLIETQTMYFAIDPK